MHKLHALMVLLIPSPRPSGWLAWWGRGGQGDGFLAAAPQWWALIGSRLAEWEICPGARAKWEICPRHPHFRSGPLHQASTRGIEKGAEVLM